jgi:hypothetical protein
MIRTAKLLSGWRHMTEDRDTSLSTARGQFHGRYPEAVAAALSRAFPGYAVTLRRDGGRQARYELISRDGRNPRCLISPDAQEIWDELNGT